jgi:hypothetical protein
MVKKEYDSSYLHKKYGKSVNYISKEEAEELSTNIIRRAEKVAGREANSNLVYESPTSTMYVFDKKNGDLVRVGKVSHSTFGYVKRRVLEKREDEVAARRTLHQRTKTSGGLEKRTIGDAAEMVAMTAGIIGLIMLGASASRITGNMIGSSARNYLISLELVLIVIGIIGAWLYLSNKEKKK